MLDHDYREAYEAALSRACKALNSARYAADQCGRMHEACDLAECHFFLTQLLDDSAVGKRRPLVGQMTFDFTAELVRSQRQSRP